MNTSRFLKCVLCVFTGLLISKEGSCLPGQTINIFLENTQKSHLTKKHGFDFSGQGHLYYQIKSCMYGRVSVSDSSLIFPNFVTFNYNTFFLDNSPQVEIGYRCLDCSTARVSKHIVSCSEYRHHWIQWADGEFALGEGQDVNNQSTRLLLATKKAINVDEIELSIDAQGSSAFFQVVKDNAPSFKFPNPDGSSQVEMVEKRPVNSTVLTVRATDPESDPLTFSVEGNDSSTFHFDGENLKISSILNMDTNDVYKILIRMTDGKNVREVNVTLLVLPLLTKGDRVSITEELPLGSMVDSLYQIHDDRTDLNFFLHGTHSDFFSINETNGKISVAKRVDRERLSRHYLDDLKVVMATSDGETTASLWINITVTDINDNLPKCVPSALYVEVPENSVELRLNISCTDRDPGVNGLMTFEILEPTVLKPLMNVSTTEISIQGNALDLETMTTDLYIVSIKVSDSSVNTDPLESMFYFQLKVLGVNEHTPTFTRPLLNNDTFGDMWVYENVSVGSIIWSVSALDADHGQDGQLTFFLHSVVSDKGKNHISDMAINNDGELMTTRILDRDSPVNGVLYYKVTVGVRDNGNPSKTSLATLHIDLKDINDNIPTFKEESYDLLISCDAAIGDQLGILEVTDPDSTSEIVIAAMNNTDGFIDVGLDGNITLAKRPENADSDREIFLRISATDGKYSVQGFLVYNFETSSTTSTPSLTTTENQTSTTPSTTSDKIIGALKDYGIEALCIIESAVLIVITFVFIYKKCRCTNAVSSIRTN